MIKDRQLMLDQNKAMLDRLAMQNKIIARLSELEYYFSHNVGPTIVGNIDNMRFMSEIKYVNTPRAYFWIIGHKIPLKLVDNIKGIK